MFENNATLGGYNYQGMPQQQKWGNVLTAEQINRLVKSDNEFSLGITEEESLRASCNHRSQDGLHDTLVFDNVTGEARCTICQYKFRPVEPNISFDEIKEDVYRIIDLLQTVKLMYIDLPDQAAKEYFQIIPLIEKIPQLFEYAAKNMTKHESYNWQYNNGNMGAMSMLNNLQQAFSSGMNMMGQQPQMGAPMGMGVPNGMPVGMVPPTMQYQQQPMGAPMSNGFGYPGAGAYQPQTSGYQFTPNQQVPVANAPATQSAPVTAPTAPDATAETATVQQTVTV